MVGFNHHDYHFGMTKRRMPIQSQPSDTTCGPTCLHALYQFYGYPCDLSSVITQTEELNTGGTLAVMLGMHALQQGWKADIHTFNLNIFDPTWFSYDEFPLHKLKEQYHTRKDPKLKQAIHAYIIYLEMGGRIHYEDLTIPFLKSMIRGNPVLTGLSGTHLYGSSREWKNSADDVRGQPVGHFVILYDLNSDQNQVIIADPLDNNPTESNRYMISIDRLINAILLGVLTYDGNLLVIQPPDLI